MATPRDGHGQVRIKVSETFIEEALKRGPGIPEDARLLELNKLDDRLVYEAVMESSEWDEQLEGSTVPEGGYE